MYINDFNSNCKKTIILLHPLLVNSKEFKEQFIDLMKLEDVRLIMPDISGHGMSKHNTFISSKEEAFIIHKYLVANGISEIKLAFGTSLGSKIIFDLLKYDDIEIDSVMMEGVSAYKNSFVKKFIYTKSLIYIKKLSKMSKSLGEKLMSLLRDKQLSEIMVKELVTMPNKSIVNIVKDLNRVELPYLRRNIQQRLNFYYGGKDSNKKYGEKRLKVLYPKAHFYEWPYFKHSEKMFKEPRSYAEIIKSFII